MNDTGSKETRILELDALRGIAALSVVFFHLTMFRPQSRLGFNLGVTGVHLFFLISGFVIFKSIDNSVSWKKFAISRVSRLYPTYWACVTFTFLIILLDTIYHHTYNSDLIYNYFFNLYMVHYYFNVPNLDNAYWTLVIEMLFYILMIVLIIIKQLKRIEMVGCIGLLIVGIYSFLLNVRFPFLFETISHFFPLIKYFPLFFAGILFYKLKNKSFQINRYVMYIIILVCLCLQISLYGKGIVDEYSVSFQEYAVMIGIYFFCFFFLLIICLPL